MSERRTGSSPPSPTMILYCVGSDKDDFEHPNAFAVQKEPTDIRLRDIRAKFPLPGIYHFRFKYRVVDANYVWVDITNEESRVPLFNNKIIAKVLRVSWSGGETSGRGGGGQDSSSSEKKRSSDATRPTAQGGSQRNVPTSSPPQSQSNPPRSSSTKPSQDTENLLGGFDHLAPALQSAGQEDMLSFDSSPPKKTGQGDKPPPPSGGGGNPNDFEFFFGSNA